jgi:V/A-type H+-transporting ATPase subunit A
MTRRAMALLQEEEELQEIVQLVGFDTLGPEQQLLLGVARMLREDYLQQHAYHEVDRYCPPPKSAAMLRVILGFDTAARSALAQGAPVSDIMALPLVEEIGRMKEMPIAEAPARLGQLAERLAAVFAALLAAREEAPA